MARATRCRSCGSARIEVFLTLGESPLADAFIRPEDADKPEPRFPLDVAFCHDCTLVQLLEEVDPTVLFATSYLYFSSFSPALLEHARDHAQGLIAARGLGPDSLVVEIASNDGYLLKNFMAAGVPVLGVDPAPEPADAAEAIGIPMVREFWDADTARRILERGRPADVIIANNVMAHVPDLNGFVEGIAIMLADDGVATIENPWVREMVARCAFDTVYHEHHCYFSCTAVDHLVRRHGLFLNDIEYFPDLHAGTLRWHVGKREAVTERARRFLAEEREIGMTAFGYYADFATRVESVRSSLVPMLRDLKRDGASIAAYGAAAKGTTLLNTFGIGAETIEYVVDRNTHKQGLLMPGNHIPIRAPDELLSDRPDYVLLLTWNFADEILSQQAAYRDLGGRFIVPVPSPTIL
jgi:SAM-dependent methyltransferase